MNFSFYASFATRTKRKKQARKCENRLGEDRDTLDVDSKRYIIEKYTI